MSVCKESSPAESQPNYSFAGLEDRGWSWWPRICLQPEARTGGLEEARHIFVLSGKWISPNRCGIQVAGEQKGLKRIIASEDESTDNRTRIFCVLSRRSKTPREGAGQLRACGLSLQLPPLSLARQIVGTHQP